MNRLELEVVVDKVVHCNLKKTQTLWKGKEQGQLVEDWNT